MSAPLTRVARPYLILALLASAAGLAFAGFGGAAGSGGVTSAALDTLLGSSQGMVAYRNGTVWTALSPGTAGQVLESGGAGANPTWEDAAGGLSGVTEDGGTPNRVTITDLVNVGANTVGSVAGDLSVGPDNNNYVQVSTSGGAPLWKIQDGGFLRARYLSGEFTVHNGSGSATITLAGATGKATATEVEAATVRLGSGGPTLTNSSGTTVVSGALQGASLQVGSGGPTITNSSSNMYVSNALTFTSPMFPSAAGTSVNTTTHRGFTWSNEGATGLATFTLPAAAGGLRYTFIVQDADGIRVDAASGDTIRIAGTVTAADGYFESTTIGDTLTIMGINATEWVAIESHGTWTAGP